MKTAISLCAALPLLLLDTTSTHAESSKTDRPILSCQASANGVSAKWEITSSGKAHLSLKDRTGTSHSCPLELIQISDFRRGVSPEAEFSAERILACSPKLPKDLAQALSVDHRLRVPLNTPGDALLSLYRADNDVPCRYRKFDQTQFSLLYKKWKLMPRRIPNQPPAEAPDDIVRSAKGELRRNSNRP